MSETDNQEVKSAVEKFGQAFEEFKETNDKRLAEIESKNSVDPLVEEKLGRIEKSLDSLEEINQKITLQEKNQENVAE